ncbi:MAG: carbohydrate kinase [Pedobacter sp.]|nr:MAG: carbohydrate kinase [Pedobacter sp.]
MYLLGIDIGTSSVKVSVVDVQHRKSIASAHFPESEAEIISLQPGWAEQSPRDWWLYTQQAILKVNASGSFDPKQIQAIGIAYQMHGLVLVDKDQNLLRDSIIWCDSRAVNIGEMALNAIGSKYCLEHLLNSPGNFTASKLRWVRENEPDCYSKIYKIMLPGDYIGMKLSGEITTSIPALSEGILWDFKRDEVSREILDYYQIDRELIPDIRPLFSVHGQLKSGIAALLGLTAGIPISYKAGDQPNNALSLNVFNPGEVAATAGTSGVIYAVSGSLTAEKQSRVNSFAHVNYSKNHKRTGVLMCINGAGSLNRWAKFNLAPELTYAELNMLASTSPPGSRGLKVIPFGNGAERMLNNRFTGAKFLDIDLNIHSRAEIFRAVQEGIAYSFRYGLDILKENDLQPEIIKAGLANLFLSDLFAQTFADLTNIPLELYHNDGCAGAALGAGIGAGIFQSTQEAFSSQKVVKRFDPVSSKSYEPFYDQWKSILNNSL